ncbi:GntR family transcriptional regulator [Streptosporangium sp. NPDC051022]|uniref:GntR family transcriptional regulator n=1 Tax=Streptosporangium sp. NPDC051022 TaxID=3155752 RepID=UPI0034442A77
MSPEVTRSDPPYIQIVRHIRSQIISGELKGGDSVPSTRQIMKDWNVAMATASKVITSLRAEGLVVAVPGRGTVVSEAESIQTPRDRVMSIRRTGRIYPPTEHARITAAELAPAPAQVADALGIEAGVPAIRRHRVTYRGDTPISASTSWFDGALAEVAPSLLETGRLVQGTPAYIEETTGRTLASGRDQLRAAAATEQEAADLDIEVGAPVLKGRNWIYDSDGNVVEYGEYVASETRWKSYDYTIT